MLLDELIEKKYTDYTDKRIFMDETIDKEVVNYMDKIQLQVSDFIWKMILELESKMNFQHTMEMYNAYELGIHDGIKLADELNDIRMR